MWCRTVVVLIILNSRLSVAFDSSEDLCDKTKTNKTCITLCNKDQDKLKTLLVRVDDGSQNEIDLSDNEYHVLVLNLTCYDNEYLRSLKLNLYDDDEWSFVNGTIRMVSGKILGNQNYCFDLFNNDSGDMFTDVMVCEWYEVEDIFTFFSIAMIVSIHFLVITLCVYGFIHELRNLHGKCLMSYVFGLLLLYSGLSTAQLGSQYFDRGDLMCIFVGYMTYFGLLISFFWLNVMCLDIWSTFRSQLKGRGSERKRFICFSFYAFGVPAILVMMTWFIDNTNFVPENFQPDIGETNCWIQNDRLVEGIYIFAPISVITVVNIILNSITAFKICEIQKETKLVRSGESQKHSQNNAEKSRFFLYLRLFIIMGAVWSIEPISWIVDFPLIFNAFHVLNCSQGIVVFVLFVWSPKVRKLIIQRYRRLRNLPPIPSQYNSGNSMRTTSSSSESRRRFQ